MGSGLSGSTSMPRAAAISRSVASPKTAMYRPAMLDPRFYPWCCSRCACETP
ncbi:hypothetical protein [Haloferax mucosum]|uniref:hypothetical protein n=1 Tax=Haloferax mucosum TaxID=403181 RepID=UPI00137567E3|nr:hypothetical protein [Haloferax mucosum]